jgi:hypothetical protein
MDLARGPTRPSHSARAASQRSAARFPDAITARREPWQVAILRSQLPPRRASSSVRAVFGRLASSRRATEREIDVAVRDIVAKAFDQATEVLRERRADLEEGARLCLAQETVTADQFPAIRSAGREPPATWDPHLLPP